MLDFFCENLTFLARENKLDPKSWTEKNILTMKKQLKELGLSIDWDREISTCSP